METEDGECSAAHSMGSKDAKGERSDDGGGQHGKIDKVLHGSHCLLEHWDAVQRRLCAFIVSSNKIFAEGCYNHPSFSLDNSAGYL